MIDAETEARIRRAVDDNFDDQLAFIAELVRQPSTRGNEAGAQDLMARTLRDRGYAVDQWPLRVDELKHMPGFSPVDIDYEAADATTVVGVQRSAGTGRSLIFNGHVDVVPVGPLDMWDSPPFEPRVADGWMYGRGACDMKSGMGAAIFAVEAIKRAGFRPAGDVQIHSVIEEECTGNGALACVQRGYRADAVLVAEPTGLRTQRTQIGVIWFQLKLRGRPVHVSVATTGSNAIVASTGIIEALKKLEGKWNARKADDPYFKDVAQPINFNVGKIAGGDWASSVPAWCTLDCRISILPGQDLRAAQREIEDVVRDAARNDPFLSNSPPEIVWNGFEAEPFTQEPDTPAELTLARVHKQVTGKDIAPRLSTATTDARFYGLYSRLPTLVYGPSGENSHGFNERVNIESVREAAKTMALFVADWCGLEPI